MVAAIDLNRQGPAAAGVSRLYQLFAFRGSLS